MQNSRYALTTLPKANFTNDFERCLKKIANFFKQLYEEICNCLYPKNSTTISATSYSVKKACPKSMKEVLPGILAKSAALKASVQSLNSSLNTLPQPMNVNQVALHNYLLDDINNLFHDYNNRINDTINAAMKEKKSPEYILEQTQGRALAFKKALEITKHRSDEIKRNFPDSVLNNYKACMQNAYALANHLINL